MGSPCPPGAALHMLESGLMRGPERLQSLRGVYSANSDVSRYTRRGVDMSLMGGSSCLMLGHFGVGIVLSHSCNYYEIFLRIFSAISCHKLSFICLGSIDFLKSLSLCLLIVLDIFWPLSSLVFLWSHFLVLLLLGLQLHLCDILSGFRIFLMLCSLLTLFSLCIL